MPQKIVFVCLHGAAKSILSHHYFQDLVNSQGLDYQSIAVGLEPDPIITPSAMNLLEAASIIPSNNIPRQIVASDLVDATIVIRFGCQLPFETSLPSLDWDDVPMVSQQPAAAWANIQAHVDNLLNQLVHEESING